MITSINTPAPGTGPEQALVVSAEPVLTAQIGQAISTTEAKKDKAVDKQDSVTTVMGHPTVKYSQGGISITGSKNTIRVADNFQLFVKYKTIDEDEQITWVLTVKERGKEKQSHHLELSHDEFCSATKLKNRLAGIQLALRITNDYLPELWDYLFRMSFPVVTKVVRLGYHAPSGLYFFANKAVDALMPQQLVVNPDAFGIVTVQRGQQSLCLSMPTIKKKHQYVFTLQAGPVCFNDWFSHMVRIYKHSDVFIPVCFYLMALYRDIVIKHTMASPILYLQGVTSSGKSSIIKSLSRLFNIDSAAANLMSKNTEVGLLRAMSQYVNGLIWMDEFYNNYPFESLLQAAHDNDGYIRAQENSARGVDTVEIHSALALTSNFIPDNPIFFNRCVFVPIAKSSFSSEQVEAFDALKAVEQEGLSNITLEMLTHRPLIEKGFKQAYAHLYAGLKASVSSEQVTERLVANMARVLSVAYILQTVSQIQLQINAAGEKAILAEFVRIGAGAILRQHQIQREKTALSEFFELLQQLYEQGAIQEEVHFRFSGNQILLRFPSLYLAYAQRYRQIFFKAPAERDTVRQELLVLTGSNEKDFFKNIRFNRDISDTWKEEKGSVQGSCSMDYSLLVDAYGIDWQGRRLDKLNGRI